MLKFTLEGKGVAPCMEKIRGLHFQLFNLNRSRSSPNKSEWTKLYVALLLGIQQDWKRLLEVLYHWDKAWMVKFPNPFVRVKLHFPSQKEIKLHLWCFG